MIKYTVFLILFIINLSANDKPLMKDKALCDKLTNSKYLFVKKIKTIRKPNKNVITNYTKINDITLDTLKIDNDRLDICEYQNVVNEEPINYLIYSNTKNSFVNDKAIRYTNIRQGLSFRSISYANNTLILFYETSGGSNRNYHNYTFIFNKSNNEFLLIKAIKNQSIEVEDGFKLKTKDITSKDSFLSSFDVANYIKKFNKIRIKTILPTKQPLYKTPNKKTKMYLIKRDKVEILKEKDDWLYILYRGKKDIKAWIPKSAVE